MSDERETWSSRASFLLACIGSAVGLGNIWRFPYLCYKSGGGAFLIPYAVMLLLCGLPLMFMEMTVGQYTRRGPIGALGKICPMLKGAGLSTVVISFWLCTYYNVIISWAMFYLSNSFVNPLPWTNCNNWWNTEDCFTDSGNSTVDIEDEGLILVDNFTDQEKKEVSSSQEFYDHRVLQLSSSIEDFGQISWELFGFLLLAWIIVYFCIWKSVKATGKVVYFTAAFPYVLLLGFLVRGCTLPGAIDGIRFFVEPRWDRVLDSKVWVYAAAQVFNSIGVAFGCLITFSSYNKFHGPILGDTLVVVFVDAFTCILCGFCVFSTMGNLALEQGKSVEEIVTDGPGLVFVVFPHALSKMPLPQLWSVIFFGMLILLGIDSQFATVEVIITSLKDGLGETIEKYLKRHEVLVFVVSIVAFLFGLPFIFQGGIYWLQIVDYYASSLSLMYIAFFECVAIVWIYGAKRLSSNVKDMTGKYPNLFFRICWVVISPLLILAIWAFSIYDYKTPTYNKIEFPNWAVGLGWCIAATSLLPIPIMAVVQIFKAKSNHILGKIITSCKSTIKECPCGCNCGLDENNEAHSNSSFSYISEHSDNKSSNLSIDKVPLP